jgi:hypothetical protein
LIEESHVLLAPMLRDSPMSDWREYSRFSTAVTRLTPARQAARRQMANAKPAITGAETKSAASAVAVYQHRAEWLFDLGRLTEIERRRLELRNINLHLVGVDL